MLAGTPPVDGSPPAAEPARRDRKTVTLRDVVEAVRTGLRDATTDEQACQATAAALANDPHAPAIVAVMLRVHNHLRCMAAGGVWQVFSSLPMHTGVIGRAYDSCRPAEVPDVTSDPDYVSLCGLVVAELAIPVTAPDGLPLGVLNLEWSDAADLEAWRSAGAEIAALLGRHLYDLGHSAAETDSERLLRHALAITTARDESELLSRSLMAAREISGLPTALIVMPGRYGGRILVDPSGRTELLRRLEGIDPLALLELVKRVRDFGSSYTLGDPDGLDVQGFEPLTAAGVRTMIAVPVRPAEMVSQSSLGGSVVLALGERVGRPSPATVNLLELLAAQSWSCLERLRHFDDLHQRATSDPLTGLGHQGKFGQRISTTIPERTALMAIDVDKFKAINDRYGHAEGDRVLVDLARALQTALRAGDELYRVGGDEFAAVVDVAKLQEAYGVAKRLLRAARRAGCTVSVGVALQAPGESAEAALRRADEALYAAKRTGRDGVHVAPPPGNTLAAAC
jgi:diguanylate cyclase (GGDEF)-like protein